MIHNTDEQATQNLGNNGSHACWLCHTKVILCLLRVRKATRLSVCVDKNEQDVYLWEHIIAFLEDEDIEAEVFWENNPEDRTHTSEQ